ncbi:hypothetical protein AVEN_11236-1 [Araneus ventricosus]|uniref:Uncharacterized protein n=1 Tax=Araneus ventricosus TaxID=182803 RepID=A0A4Y2RM54_ARAVE|nr:hypothetical protein AVEN_11236-1 [Araneus ventricosus]
MYALTLQCKYPARIALGSSGVEKVRMACWVGRHARPTRGGMLLSMRSRKQTERQLLLMESSLAYPRGKEENSKKTQGEK